MGLFMILAFILFVAWIGAWALFHVTSGLIHLLLVIALVSVILHFVRGSAPA